MNVPQLLIDILSRLVLPKQQWLAEIKLMLNKPFSKDKMIDVLGKNPKNFKPNEVIMAFYWFFHGASACNGHEPFSTRLTKLPNFHAQGNLIFLHFICCHEFQFVCLFRNFFVSSVKHIDSLAALMDAIKANLFNMIDDGGYGSMAGDAFELLLIKLGEYNQHAPKSIDTLNQNNTETLVSIFNGSSAIEFMPEAFNAFFELSFKVR